MCPVVSIVVQNICQVYFSKTGLVKQDKTIELRRITLGPTDANQVVVQTNLAADEVVVVEGTDRLHEGSQVDIAQQDGKSVDAVPELQTKTEAKGRKRDRR